ncbi:MAG: pyridoxamine 5'-phosphate oxidase family protein [Erysipelotrichales bacterium]|nr:pyridoxamine 5'-phosphate oxidase family protein [Erysipelotrichales bacterium]
MRRKDREVKDIREILQIVEKAKILHLGLFDGEYPYVVPLHYGYEYAEEKQEFTFYMHSAKEGHKLDLIAQNPNVCAELECDIELISGGEVPCAYGSAYASLIGKGHAEIVKNVEEKIKGLKLFMRNQTGREFAMDERMASSVAVLKVTVPQFTAKARRNPRPENSQTQTGGHKDDGTVKKTF